MAFGELGETAYCFRKTLTLTFGVARLTTKDGGKFLYRPLHFPCRRRISSGQTQGLSQTRQDGNGRARSGRLSGPHSSPWAREGYAKPSGENVGRTNHQVSHSSGEAERGTCSRLSQRGRVVATLTAQLEALQARLEKLERPAPSPNGSSHPSASGGGQGGGQSRRDLLKLAGAAAAGAAGSIVLGAVPAAATNNNPIVLGNSTTNDAGLTTTIFPTALTTPAPLFEALGQSVTGPTTVPPTVSSTAPASQSIPLIGAIGAGGTLPPIGSPPVIDYPGYAPIQGVGGVATVAVVVNGVPTTQVVSEGVNGFGTGLTGIGVTGESDSGYGVVGGSGGIDIAALGNGRIMQGPPHPSLLASPPAGPPTYLPNDFEMVRDQNGLLYVSLLTGKWVPVQFGGLNQSLFSAVSFAQYALTGSNGTTWMDMDATNLKLSITPLFDCIAILTANADLWTAVAGLNQDIAIAVNGAIAGWKESGGSAGTFSPNAAFLETIVQMTAGTLYTIKIQWKTNKPAAANATIYAGAGNGPYSPTRLTAHLVVNP